jgi:S1-C subfamily serine protease
VVYIRNLAVLEPGEGEVDSRLIQLNPFQIQEGTGSGFLWDEKGHVVTNYHMIHASRELDVTLASHETFPAQVVNFEVEKDIAVLRIDAPRELLRPIAVGSSSDLKVGQKVFAIGNPFGLDQTLTSGIISGLGREIPGQFEEEGRGRRPLSDLIQTDAAINRGNSGGPLLDSAGRLIGMNTAIVSPSGASSGVGFAIPVDTINRIVTEILRYGQARRPGLGVRIAPDQVAQAFRVQGVIVVEVVDGTGAARSGLRGEGWTRLGPGKNSDVIVAVDGIPVRSGNDLFRELARHSVGDKVKLKVLRGGKPLEVDVELQDLR